MDNWADKLATALINKHPSDERARLRDSIALALREARDEQRREDVRLVNDEAREPALAEWLERQALSGEDAQGG